MGTIRFNVGTDPLTGKKQKYTNVEIRFQYGAPIEFIGSMSFHEVNDDPASSIGTTERQKKAVESYMDNYSTVGRFIDSVTKLYLPGLQDLTDPQNPVPYPNAMLLTDYLELKAVNTFPSTAGGDALWKAMEGVCREMIAIRKANGELPTA